MTDRARHGPTRPDGTPRGVAGLAIPGLAAVGFAAALGLVWLSAGTLLLIFAGVLLGVFLDGLTRALGRVLALPRGLRLAIAGLAVAGALGGLATYGGATIVQQGRDLGGTIRTQAEAVNGWLAQRGVDLPVLGAPAEGQGTGGGRSARSGTQSGTQSGAQSGPQSGPQPGQQPGGLGGLASSLMRSSGSVLSEAGSVLGPAVTVVLGLFDALGNALVIVFLGLAFAANPGSYRDGTLRFVPPRRRWRAARVLDGAGETLRHWLFGQLVTMTVIFLCTWAGLAFLGIGGSLILGLQAGLLAFVPTVGPLVAGLVIVLAALASGTQALVGALGVYVAVQCLESYGLTPFIQRRALDIPPATIFAGQLLLGVVFGLWGLALALPLMAVIKVLLEQLYVEDALGEPPHP